MKLYIFAVGKITFHLLNINSLYTLEKLGLSVLSFLCKREYVKLLTNRRVLPGKLAKTNGEAICSAEIIYYKGGNSEELTD